MSDSLPANPLVSWQTTCLRTKDPEKSVPLYEKHYGMKLMDVYHYADRSHYFLARPRDSQVVSCKPGSTEAHQLLFNVAYNYVELCHIHGTEKQAEFHYDSGNNEPKRGFGHLAYLTPDVYAACAKLEELGATFKKKPDEGRMKGLAFAYDADGYWIEIVRRSPNAPFNEEFNLGQTMLRVKDAKKSLAFYTGALGMTLLTARHFDDFSLYFLMSVPPDAPPVPGDDDTAAQQEYMKSSWLPVLELTHNHGTENDPEFKHYTGNEDPKGFMNIGFVSDNLEATRDALKSSGASVIEGELAAELGAVPNKVEIVADPDGYAVKIIARGAVLA